MPPPTGISNRRRRNHSFNHIYALLRSSQVTHRSRSRPRPDCLNGACETSSCLQIPTALPPEHRRASLTTYHVEVEELMAVHGTMAAVRVDPEEHLASAAAGIMLQALAQMKSPSDYP